MSDDSRPYRSGPPLRTGDRVGVVIGDQRFEGAAQVESGPYGRQKITIIPDGEPMLYTRDYAFRPSTPDEVRAEAGLQITAHRWLPREPIPYDEMRRLCGLPDVSAYIAQRDAELKVRKQCAAQTLIYMLTRATGQLSVYRGPNQYPSYQDLRGPTQWIRHQVLLDALGTGEPFNEAAAVAIRKDLTDEQRGIVLDQCAFIREHTEPVKPWAIWANPFLPPEFNTFAKTKQERVRLPHQAQVDIGGRKPAWMVDAGLVEPAPETPQQRALPRPSTTPPPWADNPAGQRRPAKTRNHRRVK